MGRYSPFPQWVNITSETIEESSEDHRSFWVTHGVRRRGQIDLGGAAVSS